MNRRQFVRGSFVTSLTGLAGSDLLLSRGQPAAENPKLPASPNESAGRHRVYAHLLDPREHPDYTRRHVRPPSWDTFDGRTHLTCLRGFDIEDGQIVHYVEKIEKYTQKYELGDVLWLVFSTLYAENLGDLADEIKRRKLFLFDIWGYVPGSGPGGIIGPQFQVPAGVFELLESKLGERWLGMDNGEQDGRYIGGYASQLYPASADRLEQYLNFQRYFERLTAELGNKMSALVTLNFGHHFLKEGVYTLIGAETAQALPNGQLYYSFIRGAGKQYGVPWFGNASVFNRWGYKTYGSKGEEQGYAHSPTLGTSLSLLKRLMYGHILYNSMLVGFENCWFYTDIAGGQGWVESSTGGELSPIGLIQRGAGRWLSEVGQPGAMIAPIALLVDFYAGWTFPRHLYTSDVYRVWGNLPYEPGDYLTDGVLDMLYPGYQDSSYFHDESGFLTPTPYGDAVDCILSDAPGWLLERYPMLMVAGGLEGGAEVRDKFEAYLRSGGHLLITAGSLAKLPGGLAGMQVKGSVKHFEAGASVQVGETRVVEDSPFDVYALAFPKAARVLAESSGVPLAVEMTFGGGRIAVLASPFGVGAKEAKGVEAEEVRNEVDKPLAKPYPLLKHVRSILDQAFRTQMLFEVGEGLSLITCRKGPGEYTLGVSNNTWRQQPLKIVSHCGRIELIRELALDQSEKGAVGYLSAGLEKTNLGASDEGHIAGGDIRIFAVRVREENVEDIAHVAPPARPRGRALPLREARSIKEEVLARPSFFEHFDSVVVDWRYLQRREKEELERESGWIGLQGLKLLVDLSSGINLFPDLRLVDNIREDYLASLAVIEDVMGKMEAISAQDLILSLHRYPENNFTEEQSWQSFERTLRHLCERARRREVTVHLRLRVSMPPENLKKGVEFVSRVGAPNLRLAPSTAFLLARKTDLQEATRLLGGQVGLWLVDTPQMDIAGQVWNGNGLIRGYQDSQSLAKILAIAPEALLVFDALCKNHDEEYLDAKSLQEIVTQQGA
jgi:hypothetical protein